MQRVVKVHVQNFIRFVKTEKALNKVDSEDKNLKTEFSKVFLRQTMASYHSVPLKYGKISYWFRSIRVQMSYVRPRYIFKDIPQPMS